MLNKKYSKKLRKLTRIISRTKDRYKESQLLSAVTGVIHVGANKGQEIDKYSKYDLKVVWVEPITEVFEQLAKNIMRHDKQVAYQALITDVDNKEYEFNVANNNGASSSIFQLKEHKEVWPSVYMTKKLLLKSTTLTSLLRNQSIDPAEYQGLIIDTQGAELLVLKGSLPLLKHFRFIKVEVANFESYEGGCLLSEMNEFMHLHGFKESHRKKFGGKSKKGGHYYNVTYVTQIDTVVE